MAYPTFSVRVPSSLMDDLKAAAERDGQTVNNFIVQAVAEKLAVLRARGLTTPLSPDEQREALSIWTDRTRSESMEDILRRAGTSDVVPGDELPDGWPDAAPQAPVVPASVDRDVMPRRNA